MTRWQRAIAFVGTWMLAPLAGVVVLIAWVFGVDVRAAATAARRKLILHLLWSHGKMRGLELVELAHGRLRRGSVYVLLEQLEDDGLIESAGLPPIVPGGPAPRLYWITPAGRQAVLHGR